MPRRTIRRERCRIPQLGAGQSIAGSEQDAVERVAKAQPVAAQKELTATRRQRANWVNDRVLPSGSGNHAMREPPGAVHTPFSS